MGKNIQVLKKIKLFFFGFFLGCGCLYKNLVITKTKVFFLNFNLKILYRGLWLLIKQISYYKK
jgi:hypothetical protein